MLLYNLLNSADRERGVMRRFNYNGFLIFHNKSQRILLTLKHVVLYAAYIPGVCIFILQKPTSDLIVFSLFFLPLKE